TPSTKWRTEQARMLAYGVAQGTAAIHEFSVRARFRFEDKKRMCERVIADLVSRRRDCSRDVGPFAHKLPDHEEGGVHAVFLEHIEQLQGVRIVRPVVIGESELLAFTFARGKSPPVPLACWRHGLVSR